jgi:hypothetical protein
MGLTENYISIPKKLIVDLRDTPLALALYFFIARLYLVLQAPVPLSRGDIRLFDPCAKIGAIKRALDRLVQDGWLLELRGYKSSYIPTWGKNRAGTPYQWKVGAPLLGCPWEVWRDATRIDRALLDVFMGRLTPQPRLAADIVGYFIDGEGRHTPLLQLREIGAYMLIAAGFPSSSTDELRRWGLVHDSQAQPIPDDAVVLALASQRASIADFWLSKEAWYKLGWFGTRSSQPTVPAGAEPAPLIFVPKERIGGLIPHVIGESIGCSPFTEGGNTAAESAQTTARYNATTMIGISQESRESRDSPPYPPTRDSGGGGVITSTKEENRRIALPNTESAHALFSIGVNDPDCLVELSTLPFEQVGGAIRYAESEALGPGWIVTALRRHRDEGWPIPKLRSRRGGSGGIDVASVMNGPYSDLFRLGSDMSDLTTPRRSEQVQISTPSRQAMQGAGVLHPGASLAVPRPPATASAAAPRPAPVWRSAVELTQELRSRLCMGCDRSYHRVIEGLHVHLADNITVIHCASLSDRLRVLEALMGALRAITAELGLPPTIRVTDAAPPPEEQTRVVGQPASGVSSTA